MGVLISKLILSIQYQNEINLKYERCLEESKTFDEYKICLK
jgi:hypothetical protein